MQTSESGSRKALTVSSATHIVQDGLTTTITVLLPVLAQAFGLAYAEVGLLKGIKTFAQALMEMCSGWLSERLGEYQLIVVGLLFSGAGFVLLSIAPGLTVILVSLLVVGMGTALHHAPSSALIAMNYATGKRSGALGLYNASGDIGKLVFTGGFSLATGAGLAWSRISLTYGLVALFAAIAIVIATAQRRSQLNKKFGTTTENEDQSKLTGWGILNWHRFGILLAVISIDNLVQTSVLVFMAFLMLAKGLPLWLATGGTVTLLVGGVAGKAVCGYLAERLGVRLAFTLIQILTAVGLAVIVIAPNWLALALLLPLGAVVQGSTSITYGFAAYLIHPKRMARGYALLYASGSFTAAAGPLFFGLIGDRLGISTSVYAMAIATLLAVPLIFIFPAASSQEVDEQPANL